VTLRAEGEATFNGAISSGSRESLWIELDDAQAQTEAGLPSTCCEAVLELDRTRYLFETNILAVIEDGGARRLEVVRPEGLQVLQRRRFWRTSVHEPSGVHLARANTDDGESWSAAASMLNVSPAGLACLADREQADATAIGDLVSVTFDLPGGDELFAIQGVVKSKTPAGTEGRIVLGLEFRLEDDREQFQRLQAALAPSV
jgi:c-di-GMP-binding flagellar brake protein YcgR